MSSIYISGCEVVDKPPDFDDHLSQVKDQPQAKLHGSAQDPIQDLPQDIIQAQAQDSAIATAQTLDEDPAQLPGLDLAQNIKDQNKDSVRDLVKNLDKAKDPIKPSASSSLVEKLEHVQKVMVQILDNEQEFDEEDLSEKKETESMMRKDFFWKGFDQEDHSV